MIDLFYNVYMEMHVAESDLDLVKKYCKKVTNIIKERRGKK